MEKGRVCRKWFLEFTDWFWLRSNLWGSLFQGQAKANWKVKSWPMDGTSADPIKSECASAKRVDWFLNLTPCFLPHKESTTGSGQRDRDLADSYLWSSIQISLLIFPFKKVILSLQNQKESGRHSFNILFTFGRVRNSMKKIAKWVIIFHLKYSLNLPLRGHWAKDWLMELILRSPSDH